MQKLLPFLFCLLLLPLTAKADYMDKEDAQGLANEFFKNKNKKTSEARSFGALSNPRLIYQHPAYKNPTKNSSYVFTPESGKGFVVIAGDDRLPSVIGYSEDSNFDPNNIPPLLQEFLNQYSVMMESLQGKDIILPHVAEGEAVSPLIKTKWDQGEPYNRLVSFGADYVTGCTATAMAQVMKYHEWPKSGTGIVSSYYSDGDIDLSLSHYDWENMLDTYLYDRYNDTQADAVALLMRDAGYALNSSYGYTTSASIESPTYALVRNFGYSPDIKFINRETCSTQKWTDLIRESLLRKEPVLLSGQSFSGGHAFICDGITTDNLFHINWGWSGMSDGYYNMNALTPSSQGIGGGQDGYNYLQTLIYNIRKNENSDFNASDYLIPLTLNSLFLAEAPENDKLDTHLPLGFSLFNTSGVNIDYDHSAHIAVVFSSLNGEIVFIPEKYGFTVFDLSRGYYTYGNSIYFPLSELEELPDGDYFASLRYSYGERYDNDMNPRTSDLYEFMGGDLAQGVPFSKKNGEYYAHLVDGEEFFDNVILRNINMGNTVYEGTPSCPVSITLYNGNNAPLMDKRYIGEGLDGYIFLCNENNERVASAFFLAYLYDNTEVSFESMFYNFADVSAGKYRAEIVILQNGYEYTLKSEVPTYIEVEKIPENGTFFFNSSLKLNAKEYERSNKGIIFDFTIFPRVKETYSGNLELRARYLGDNDDVREYYILQLDDNDKSITPNTYMYTPDFIYYYSTLFNAPLGEYEAYIVYEDAQGEMIPVAGDNNKCNFTLVDNEKDPGLVELTAPVIINNGELLKFGYKDFDIKISVKADDGIDFSEKPIYVFLEDEDGNYLGNWLFYTYYEETEYEKLILAPGEIGNITFHCVTIGNNEGKDLDQDYRLVFQVGPYYDLVQTYPYISSLKVRYSDELPEEEISISLNTNSLELNMGETYQFTAIVDSTKEETITWSSSNPEVATVSAYGFLETKGTGITIIRASIGDAYDECIVKVEDKIIPIEDIYLDPPGGGFLYIGETFQINVRIYPENATDQFVEWSTSDPNVITVTQSGLVEAVGAGHAVVYARCGEYNLPWEIDVYPVLASNIQLNTYDLQLNIGEEFQLEARVYPENTTDKSIVWISEDPTVAIVSDNGLVKALKGGKTIISAFCGTIFASIEITVMESEIKVEDLTLNYTSAILKVGENLRLIATVSPDNATDKSITWDSSNPEVATVSSDGLVNALMVGTATITATCSNFVSYAYITVIESDESEVEVVSITLNLTSNVIRVGENFQLTANVAPDNATDKTILWESSDNNVATVTDDGFVTGIAVGSAEIKATCGDVSATCYVTVMEEAGIESIIDNPEAIVSVYTMEGHLVKKDCKVEKLKTLAKGIYIIVSGKNRFKISI